MDNTKQTRELPYDKLAIIGIDREKADKLPEDVKNKLANGEVTPLIQVSMQTRNGTVISLPLKLQLASDKQGNPMLVAYPVRKELEQENILRLTDAEKERLSRGEVIQKSINLNGEKSRQYLQLDPETKSVIHKRLNDIKIEQKLKDMEKVNDIELGTQQKQQVRDGKPVELNVGGEKVSVGLDLREPQGFRVMKGDLKEWERQQKIQYDILHPEYIGLVMTDKNRWEYQQVVEQDSRQRAFNLDPDKKKEQSSGMKL